MSARSGFSLMEIGIVVTIIALIAAGVLVGKSMITSAELRAITTEENIYATAFKEFIDKYQAIAGDMNNAESLWGSDATCPTTATNTILKVATCNGDGTGTIGNWANGATSGGTEYEWFRAWQHFSDAGLIASKFTGVRGAATSTTTNIGVNVPLSKGKGGGQFAKTGWTLMWMNSTTDNNFFFATVPVASHTLIYGVQTASSFTDTGILAPVNAKNIDSKIDDGLPYTGNIRSKRADATTCGAAASVAAATTATDYNVGSDTAASTPACQLMFILGM